MMQASDTKICWEVALASLAAALLRSHLSFSSNSDSVSEELWATLAVGRYGVKRGRRSDKSVEK